jgi:hypothetical protein
VHSDKREVLSNHCTESFIVTVSVCSVSSADFVSPPQGSQVADFPIGYKFDLMALRYFSDVAVSQVVLFPVFNKLQFSLINHATGLAADHLDENVCRRGHALANLVGALC